MLHVKGWHRRTQNLINSKSNMLYDGNELSMLHVCQTEKKWTIKNEVGM